MHPHRRLSAGKPLGLFLCLAILSAALPPPVRAYFGRSFRLESRNAGTTDHPYLLVPRLPVWNTAAGFTVEAWVRLASADGCNTFVGANYTTGYWLGVCGTTLRSYSSGELLDGGAIPIEVWTHVALVVTPGGKQQHFISFAKVAERDTTLTTPLDDIGIGADPSASYYHGPDGWIDEVRIWNRALSPAELSGLAKAPLGLTNDNDLRMVFHFEGDATESANGFDGNPLGGAQFGVAPMDLGSRFAVSVDWQTSLPSSGQGQPLPQTSDSGIFYFFTPGNYELLVKVIDGCALNNRYWVFVAGLTNVGVEVRVRDARGGERTYANPLGSAFTSVQDTSAFAACP